MSATTDLKAKRSFPLPVLTSLSGYQASWIRSDVSAGLAVVASDCEGSREILAGRYGTLVPVGDAAALATALDRALATAPDPGPGVSRAREFSAEAGLDQWERLFTGLAATD